MRRRSSIFSIPGLIILVILLTGLGIVLWRQGGLAFSPGPLSSKAGDSLYLGDYTSHADFEQQCSQCHQPLTSIQGELCTTCHSNVRQQMITLRNLHGSIKNAIQCAECHSDHQGRDYDLRLGQLDDFDHSELGFTLTWHQVDYSLTSIECLDCHVSDGEFSASSESCRICHAGNNKDFMQAHLVEFGGDCITCHDGKDSLVNFDHSMTDFPLLGTHLDLGCTDCHVDGQFEDLAAGCIDCHAEPAVHLGVFSLSCGDCHNSQSWMPARLDGSQFDHVINTGFELVKHMQDFHGEPITCESCHQGEWSEFSNDTCVRCHTEDAADFIAQHRAQLGDNCVDCHDGADRMMSFVHDELFPLDGRHAELECQACHLDFSYQDTPDECVDCHPEPEIHAGFFGLQCEYCHTTDSWYPGQLHSHQFPIDHGKQQEVVCAVCHTKTYQEYTCFECHEHQENEIRREHAELGLAANELFECAVCHQDGLVHEEDEGEG